MNMGVSGLIPKLSTGSKSAANCEDSKDGTLTALGLVCGDRFYDL